VDPRRFDEITTRYAGLRVAVVGDFCLDRYFDIDPRKAEVSLETGLAVHNVTRVRCQPGAAGTILNNLVALGVGEVHVVGFCGEDGEGWALRRALEALPGVHTERFLETSDRATFTYTKPLILEPDGAPVELNRIDIKNWTPTPPKLEARIASAVEELSTLVDAMVVLDQVDIEGTGVVTRGVLDAVARSGRQRASLPILADCRRGLRGYPPLIFKMNAAELAALAGGPVGTSVEDVRRTAAELSRSQGRLAFVTLAERGMVGSAPDGRTEHVAAFPTRGPIDIVGAGDAVTASLASALAAGASLRESLELANAAASIVIHQLGTTGTAGVSDLRGLLAGGASS
jgi:rfaE bifunctional protein kinase chain/domain